MKSFALTAGTLAAAALVWYAVPSSAETSRRVPAPTADLTAAPTAKTETAVFAGGCFWGVQGVFQRVKGVSNAVSGYAGGDARTARYEEVGSGRTGHAESVRITYDPQQISYGKLLQIYFSVAHDPTELNRQGPDTGTQYRSQIFTSSPEQAKIADAYIKQLDSAHAYNAPVVTKIGALRGFYPAEAYHQDFLTLNPDYPYIVINDLPKVAALKRLFPDYYRTEPVLVAAK